MKSHTPESVCSVQISLHRMDSPSYLEPAIGLWDWIICWRLGSNSSGFHRLLKAIWQCFHTLISAASPLTVSRGCQNKRLPLDFLTYKNIKQLRNRAVSAKSTEAMLSFNLYACIDNIRCQSIIACANNLHIHTCKIKILDFQQLCKNEIQQRFCSVIESLNSFFVQSIVTYRKMANPHFLRS